MFLIILSKRNKKLQLHNSYLANKLELDIHGHSLNLYSSPTEIITSTNKTILIGKPYDSQFKTIDITCIEYTRVHSYYGDFIYISFEKDIFVYLSLSLKYRLYFLKIEGRVVFSDNISLLTSLIDLKLRLNWDYMLVFLQKGNVLGSHSPFLNIFELSYSCVLLLKLNNMMYEIIPCCQFLSYFERFKDKDIGNWEDSLIENLKYSLKSIENKHIFLELSGGLDSSLICFLLAEYYRGSYELSAINMYNANDVNSDERNFATSIAATSRIPLDYIDTSLCLPFTESKFIFKPNNPSVTFNCLAMDNILAEYISFKTNVSKVLVSGHGSDSLFFAVPLLESIVDAFVCEGIVYARNKFHQLRKHYNNPLLRDLLMCLNIYFRYLCTSKRKPFNLFKTLPSCAWLNYTDDIIDSYYLHPYFSSSLNLKTLPGKASQIENFFFTMASTDRQVETIYPFLNKYVIESAFLLPTFYTFDASFSRSAIRAAFSKIGGTKFAYRRGKGQSTTTFFRGIRVNFNYILNLCMEGVFAQRGYIDKEILYNDLYDVKNGVMGKAWYISNLFCAELFINQWAEDLKL